MKLIVLLIIVAICLLIYTVLRVRERRKAMLIAKHNRRLALVLRTTKVRVWLYDVERQTLSWMSTNGEMDAKEHRLDEYAHIYSHQTFEALKKALTDMAEGRQENSIVEMAAGESRVERDTIIKLSVFRRSRKGTPKVIVGMIGDQTERQLARRKAKDEMLRYETIFSNSMVDMTYYNTEGILTDINQKACETFNCDRESLLKERVSLNFALEDSDMRVEQFEGSYTTHIIRPVNNHGLAESIKLSNVVYYEQQLMPVYDSANRFLGIFGSGRDVSEFVNSYHQQKHSISQMRQAAKAVTDYINNINYALQVGGIRLVNYSSSTHVLTIYSEMNVVQLALTQSRCLSLIDDASKRIALRLFNDMDLRVASPVDVSIKTNLRVAQGLRMCLQIHMNPVYDEAGNVEGYFGMCLDVSKERATAEELEREKAKAQEVESVKTAFLRNMSYEIRTPITTVVGFAELFDSEHDSADEESFIAQIKQNTNYLLKLVNDILYLSRLDAHMIEFRKTPVDVANTFEGHCQIGWGQEKRAGVEYIVENPYEMLVVELDENSLSYVIEKTVAMAAYYTEKGYVRARYDYIGDRLLLAIEDTGGGMDDDMQRVLFERFSRPGGPSGTGLCMTICRELVQQMGGRVNLVSAVGKGTIIWIELPCKATAVVKRLGCSQQQT